MNTNLIILSALQVLGAANAILVGQKPTKKYVNGKATDETIGTTFTVVAQGNLFEKINVKVEGKNFLPYSEDEIREACKNLAPILVTFDGFEGKLYNSNGNTAVSCSAKDIRVVSATEDFNSIDIFKEG